MKRYLLPPVGIDCKTNLHMHSTVSDGHLSPEELRQRYRARGYSACAFTDHEVLIPHPELTDGGFVALSGFEVAIKEDASRHTGDRMPAFHLNLIAKDPENTYTVAFSKEYCSVGNAESYVPFITYSGEDYRRTYTVACVNDIIRKAHAAGFLVFLNHPRWSLQSESEYAPIEGLDGVEVYNTASADMGDCDAAPYDLFLRQGKAMLPIAADDTHTLGELFGGYTVLRVPSLGYAELIRALEEGNMYASIGVEISELFTEDGYITVKTKTPVTRAVLRTATRKTLAVFRSDGAPFTEATFRIPTGHEYVRIELLSREGKRAWTRAYFEKELF